METFREARTVGSEERFALPTLQTSTYGPAPGLIPGGPNPAYDGTYVLNRTRAAYAYRDFSVSCVYANNMCTGASWEITAPMAAYEGPFILLVSFEM